MANPEVATNLGFHDAIIRLQIIRQASKTACEHFGVTPRTDLARSVFKAIIELNRSSIPNISEQLRGICRDFKLRDQGKEYKQDIDQALLTIGFIQAHMLDFKSGDLVVMADNLHGSLDTSLNTGRPDTITFFLGRFNDARLFGTKKLHDFTLYPLVQVVHGTFNLFKISGSDEFAPTYAYCSEDFGPTVIRDTFVSVNLP